MRSIAALIVLLIPPIPAGAQEVDRTDPEAVARAYIEACKAGEAEMALGLIEPGDPLLPVLRDGVEELGAEPERMGLSFAQIFTEFMFIPTRVDFDAGEPVVETAEDGTTQVTVRRTLGIDQKLVMAKADDGTWSIKAFDSVKATTDSDWSFMQREMGGGRRARAADDQGEPQAFVWDSENRLRRLARAFNDYAEDHGNMLPPAATWMDDIQPYVLDPDLFQCPAAPEQEYGYAMNAFVDEAELPPNWGDRRKLVILFEWRDAERNQIAIPDLLSEMEPLWEDGVIVMVDAGQNTRRMPQGMTLDEMMLDEELRSTCESNLRTLTQAALEFARDNDGFLPGADSWQDDIALHLLDDAGAADLHRCPAADQIEFAYAINAAVAGKDARELRGHDRITLFFECDKNVVNASGDPLTDGPSPARHVYPYDTGRRNVTSTLSGNTSYQIAPAGGGP